MDCRQIFGMTTDHIANRIIMLTGSSSFIECTTYDYESGKSETFGRVASDSLPKIKELAFANGKLLLLTEDGRLGITELSLESIAYLPQSNLAAFAVRREGIHLGPKIQPWLFILVVI